MVRVRTRCKSPASPHPFLVDEYKGTWIHPWSRQRPGKLGDLTNITKLGRPATWVDLLGICSMGSLIYRIVHLRCFLPFNYSLCIWQHGYDNRLPTHLPVCVLPSTFVPTLSQSRRVRGIGESAPLSPASPASNHVPLLQGLTSRLSSGRRRTFLTRNLVHETGTTAMYIARLVPSCHVADMAHI